MLPQKYFKKFAARIVKRSGLARPTVEAMLPHVFDEIRYILTEEKCQCVPIEGFGTFAVIDKPEHEFLYHRGDLKEIRIVPAKKVIKFAPTRNLRQEVDAGHFDPTRKSFSRHPGDPAIRKRQEMRYRKVKGYQREEGANSRPIYQKRKEAD